MKVKIRSISLFFTLTHVPVGHDGTFSENFGGEFSRMTRTWFDYVLKGNSEVERLFKNHDLTGFDGWTIRSKNFD